MASDGGTPSRSRPAGRVASAVRLVLPATGALAMSGAQFVLVFVLLRRLPVADFGAQAFVLVVHQFLIGCWSALFAAPLLVFLSSPDAADRDRLPAALAATALAAAPLALTGVALLAWLNGFDAVGAIGFALFSALMLTRHFARAWYLAEGRRGRVIASDYAYGLVLLVLAGALLEMPQVSLRLAALGQVFSALPALALLVPGPAAWHRAGAALAQIGHYREVWRRDARWSLAGVLASELTANVHAYLVTGLYGAVAYAPIAATALFIRPVLVLINPLTDFERMRMAAAMGRGDWAGVRRQHGLLAGTILGAWALTVLAAVAIIGVGGTAVLHDRVPLPVMMLSTALWFVVVLMRGAHAAEGAVLQGAGQFRLLARLALVTAVLSAAGAVLAARLGGPVWSTGGVAIGEGCYVLLLMRQRRRLFAEARHGA
jgi:hypothetical protein